MTRPLSGSTVVRGVPQSSVPRPGLFNLFINYIEVCINSKIVVFLGKEIHLIQDVTLQGDLDELGRWTETW